MFASSKELLIEARKEGYALGHFNVFNMESIKAVVSAIDKAKNPAFVAVTETSIRYAGLPIKSITSFISDIVESVNGKEKVILHLDHGKNLEIIKDAIDGGFSSVMIDGSALPFEENVELTSGVVSHAHKKGVAVEAELGHVGRVGEIIPSHYLTKPERAEEFVERTGIDSLAIAIGTIHGLVTEMNLDFERLNKIASKVKIPLVIHGGTGVKNKDIAHMISLGVTKINLDTALRIAFMRGLRQNITETDPRKSLTSAMEEVQAIVEEYIRNLRKVKA